MLQFPSDFHEPCILTASRPRPSPCQLFLKTIRTLTCWAADLWMQCASLIAASMGLGKDLGHQWGGCIVSACLCVSLRELWICFLGALPVCRSSDFTSQQKRHLPLWGGMDKCQLCQSATKPQAALLRYIWLAGHYSSRSTFSPFSQLCSFFLKYFWGHLIQCHLVHILHAV